jgi:hypothetical protein
MAYKQYTSCVKPSNFKDISFASTGGILFMTLGAFTFLVFFVSLIAAIYAAIATGGVSLKPTLIALSILIAELITFLYWWLNGRLICLGDDERNCAIVGMVIGHGPSSTQKKAGDDDYTMNILLPLSPFRYDENPDEKGDYFGLRFFNKELFWNTPQGYTIKENSDILNIGRGYPESENSRYVKALHCEFEGSGIRNILNDAIAVQALLLFAILSPPIIDLLASILILIIIFISAATNVFKDTPSFGSGNPLDVGLNPAELHDGDIVVVKGEWIYDSLHIGWNEIHPVKYCRKIKSGRENLSGFSSENDGWSFYEFNDTETNEIYKLDTIDNVKKLISQECEAIKGAEKAEEDGNRDNPEHDWKIHPLIDGYSKPVVIN